MFELLDSLNELKWSIILGEDFKEVLSKWGILEVNSNFVLLNERVLIEIQYVSKTFDLDWGANRDNNYAYFTDIEFEEGREGTYCRVKSFKLNRGV